MRSNNYTIGKRVIELACDRPDMQELTEGVFAFPIETEFGGEEVVIHPSGIETDSGLILLDVGFPGEADALAAQLAEAGFGFEDVELIVITHQDSDHAGALSEVTDRSGALVAAHADDVPYIDGERDPIKGGSDRYPSASVDIELVDGVTFQTTAGPLRVVATPGHTPGHISQYLPDETLLLAADALVADEQLTGPNEQFTPDMERASESVGRLAELDIERTLVYHGGFVEEGTDRIKEIRQSLAK
jgi:glyoxylase-like metal-dependent hydrolase (beta-lactamase superfamily II)